MLKQPTFPKINLKPIILLTSIALLVLSALVLVINFVMPHYSTAQPQTVSALPATIDKGTMGLLKQTALHLSKLNGGESVGGFPGFEPPDDDEAYKRKIKEREYTPQDANGWIKEINNFLSQVIKKNPNMTLEQILQKAGLSATEIKSFIDALRNSEVIARSWVRYGVSEETLATFDLIMEQLGVTPWIW